MASGWFLAMDHQQSLEQFLEALLRQKTPIFIGKCGRIQGAPEAAKVAFHQPQEQLCVLSR